MVLSGAPDDVSRRLIEIIRGRIYSFDVARFYIGRTFNLAGRQKQHGCDLLIPLYQTQSLPNAKTVEAFLIRHFGNHKKFFFGPSSRNTASDSRGRTTQGIQYVYLAIWRPRFF